MLLANWAIHSPVFREYRVGPRGQLKSRAVQADQPSCLYIIESISEFQLFVKQTDREGFVVQLGYEIAS
jgi:hypothetical protein